MLGWNVPPGHVTAEAEPLGQYVPTGQIRQDAADPAPVVAFKVPPGQGVGLAAPVGQYAPAGQI